MTQKTTAVTRTDARHVLDARTLRFMAISALDNLLPRDSVWEEYRQKDLVQHTDALAFTQPEYDRMIEKLIDGLQHSFLLADPPELIQVAQLQKLAPQHKWDEEAVRTVNALLVSRLDLNRPLGDILLEVLVELKAVTPASQPVVLTKEMVSLAEINRFPKLSDDNYSTLVGSHAYHIASQYPQYEPVAQLIDADIKAGTTCWRIDAETQLIASTHLLRKLANGDRIETVRMALVKENL
jgi:hypothetical protein